MSAAPPGHDVVALGNALVDVLSYEDDDFLVRHGLARGAMTLVDRDRAEALYAAMGPGTEISGGSAANTVAGLASFGGRAAFVGRVADDQLGAVFAHDLHAMGVDYATIPAAGDAATGRCLVVVTPDAQRTLSTFLGAAAGLEASVLDEAQLASAAIVYLEGYLWDEADAKAALRRAADLAHGAGNRVAFPTLSDSFCVDRHRAEFVELVEHHVDVLFANESEITSLYSVDNFEDAAARVRGHCEVAALTRSAKGAVIVSGSTTHHIDAVPTDVVDTTGAGDLFAAGFLYGMTHGHDLETAGRLGTLAAAEVISHLGARPEHRMSDLAAPLLSAH